MTRSHNRPLGADFRLDIQGLRAFAVVVVVLYHLWPKQLSGGYVGVDVFFVISGFLITSHLVREVTTTGTISLTRFWARRIRRLLPAAFMVLIASLALAFWVLPSALRAQNLWEALASATYVQNWRLAFNATDYFARENDASLVEHYWSLSVEEQFYLVWPVLIIVALTLLARGAGEDRRRRVVVALLSAIAVASFVVSIVETARSQPTAYFVTPARAWEFAAGGLVALLPSMNHKRAPALTRLASWVAVAALAASALAFDAKTAFPGWIAIVPVAATVWLLWSGDDDHAWSPQFLTHAGPVQVLGDWSYAIYLWHWPLIVAWPALFGPLSRVDKAAIFVVTIVLAMATKRFIEDPVRRLSGAWRSPKRAFGFMVVGMAAIGAVTVVPNLVEQHRIEQLRADFQSWLSDEEGCAGAYAITNDCDHPYAWTERVDTAYAAQDAPWSWGWAKNHGCVQADTDRFDSTCIVGPKNATKTIALVGDSHARALLPAIQPVLDERGWRIQVFQKNSCSGLISRADSGYMPCVRWSSQVNDYLTTHATDFDAVLFASWSRPKHFTQDHLVSLFDTLRDAGTGVLVVGDAPGMSGAERGQRGQKAPACVDAARGADDPCARPFLKEPDPVVQIAEQSGVPTIDLRDLLCDDKLCHALVGSVVVYHDTDHMTTSFARTLAPWVEKGVDKALAGVSRS